MEDLNSSISIIILNVNGFNNPVKIRHFHKLGENNDNIQHNSGPERK
jgi:hypothetical protein